MRLLLCLLTIGLVVAIQAQTPTENTPALEVIKFKCGTYREPSSVIRSVQDPDPPMDSLRTNRLPRNETQEERNRRDIAERRAELARAEKNAALSTNKTARLYIYHLEIKNVGPRTIKSFAWAYQPTGVPDISDRQFFCGLNAKPNDRKEFDLLSPMAPSRVVDVSSAGQKSDKDPKGVVVINKVEYTDGSIWVRRGWNPATFTPEFTNKVEAGKCVGL